MGPARVRLRDLAVLDLGGPRLGTAIARAPYRTAFMTALLIQAAAAGS